MCGVVRKFSAHGGPYCGYGEQKKNSQPTEHSPDIFCRLAPITYSWVHYAVPSPCFANALFYVWELVAA